MGAADLVSDPRAHLIDRDFRLCALKGAEFAYHVKYLGSTYPKGRPIDDNQRHAYMALYLMRAATSPGARLSDTESNTEVFDKACLMFTDAAMPDVFDRARKMVYG